MAVRGVVVAIDAQHAVDDDAGDIHGDEDDGLLLVGVRVAGVGFAHNDQDFASWVTDSGGPPFLYSGDARVSFSCRFME